jgi:hypothetical protein
MVPTSVGQKIVRYNADGGTRTHDLMLRRHALYPLSYVSMGTLYHACQREGYKNTISSLYLHIKESRSSEPWSQVQFLSGTLLKNNKPRHCLGLLFFVNIFLKKT